VKVTANGKPQKVSSQMAAIMRLLAMALNGDAKALDTLLKMAREQSAEHSARAQERQLTVAFVTLRRCGTHLPFATTAPYPTTWSNWAGSVNSLQSRANHAATLEAEIQATLKLCFILRCGRAASSRYC